MAAPSHQTHREKGRIAVNCGVITVSDTRTEETDGSGQLIRDMLIAAGHTLKAYHIIPDEPTRIRPLLQELTETADLDAVIINGGTGISKRDVTFDALQSMLEKTLPGFGEIFRMLSFEEIGAAALLSRATAGIVAGKVVFLMPGSRGAVRLAMERLILSEMGHIVTELRK